MLLKRACVHNMWWNTLEKSAAAQRYSGQSHTPNRRRATRAHDSTNPHHTATKVCRSRMNVNRCRTIRLPLLLLLLLPAIRMHDDGDVDDAAAAAVVAVILHDAYCSACALWCVNVDERQLNQFHWAAARGWSNRTKRNERSLKTRRVSTHALYIT